ncbi:unnamed protein product [Thlaspi arvense]|uniref:Uncharacterized protein n=1 Tax=Thlaspi arvense TaxID=13288 RepID=A0AAU9RP54_THLAR|nr:unnamed protein product [Thlaspi arvense]
MVDSSNKKRKEFISEGDIAALLQRYDAMTILKLLQEMAYHAKPKMDWNELVKKTNTGITNAREYQLLWRHLAYRDSLFPMEDNAQLPDDDSDMECELESSPAVSVDAVAEAVAHVKVIAASYVPSESDIPEDSTVEAPLTINIPYGLQKGPQEPSDSYWSSRGMNITFPVSLQKPAEGQNGNGLASSMAPRKRRKKWSTEEDEELIAAVKRHGDGNWALMAKEEYEGERTASQLSQVVIYLADIVSYLWIIFMYFVHPLVSACRWGTIKKKYLEMVNSSSQSGLQRTEAQLAANRALSLAVGNRAPSKKLAVGIPPTPSSGSIAGAQANGANSGSSLQGQQQSQPVVQALARAATSVPAAKSRLTAKKTAANNSTSRAELMVTANSVAAAACMSGSVTAASVAKVETGKNAVPVLVPKVEPVNPASSIASFPRPSGLSSSVTNGEPAKTTSTSAASFPRPSGTVSASKPEPVKSASPAFTPRPSGIISAPIAEPVKPASPASFLRPSGTLSASNPGPVNTASPRPSGTLSAPKAGPVKSVAAAATASATATNTQVAGPSNIRNAVNGSPRPTMFPSAKKPSLVAPLFKGPPTIIQNKSVPSTFASSRLAPIHTVPTATGTPQKPSAGAAVTATATGKPVVVQKEQTQEIRASPLATTTLQPNKTISTNSVVNTVKPVAEKVVTPPEVGSSSTDKGSLAKPSEKESSTTVSPLVVAEAESKPKDETSKEKSTDAATVTGTVQKGL